MEKIELQERALRERGKCSLGREGNNPKAERANKGSQGGGKAPKQITEQRERRSKIHPTRTIYPIRTILIISLFFIAHL